MCLSIQPRDAHGGCLGLGSMHMGGCLGLGCVPMGAALALAAACPQIWINFQKMRVFLEKEVICPMEAGIVHARVPRGMLACMPHCITPRRPALQQNWPNGEPTGWCQEHADAEARREAHVSRHDCSNNVSTGITTARDWAVAVAIHIGPHLESIGWPAVAVPHPT